VGWDVEDLERPESVLEDLSASARSGSRPGLLMGCYLARS
jgi:hypothetical protein